MLDLGADEYTVGRAHPMLDAALRVEEIERAAKEPDSAVLLVDVVLGHGAASDPAGDIAPALEAARRHAQAHGRGLAVVASVVGTAADPQGLAAQTARLEAAGAWVLPSNAQAARAAACIVGERARGRGAARGGERLMADFRDLFARLGGELRVVNLGLESFAETLEALGVPVLHVQWTPPAGGDPERARLLSLLDDEDGAELIKEANAAALARLVEAQPVLVDCVPAREALGLPERTVLHSGPPLAWERACPPVQTAVLCAIRYEGWAADDAAARRLVERGARSGWRPAITRARPGP